jgi:hypothetical protein
MRQQRLISWAAILQGATCEPHRAAVHVLLPMLPMLLLLLLLLVVRLAP